MRFTATVDDVSGYATTNARATPGEDYERIGGTVLMVVGKYQLEDGRWVGRTDVIVPLLDDGVREGTETFEPNLVPPTNQSGKAEILNPGTRPWSWSRGPQRAPPAARRSPSR